MVVLLDHHVFVIGQLGLGELACGALNGQRVSTAGHRQHDVVGLAAVSGVGATRNQRPPEAPFVGQVDRRALGAELRWFADGLSLSSQLDYDVALKRLNIATLQCTWRHSDNTAFNLMFDRRKTPMLMLGNTLFFSGLIQPPPTRVSELIDAGQSLDTLRQQVRGTTPNSIQAALGVSTPLAAHWQVGVDLRYTNTQAVAPVPDLLPQGQPSTGDIYNLSLQFIGTNLYPARDTHVFIVNAISAPAFQGQLVSYHHSSLVWSKLQFEPSLRYYR